jgi:hypothetical protein
VDKAPDALEIHVHEPPAPLQHLSRDEYGIDVARVHPEQDGAVRVVYGHDVDGIHPQEDQIGFLSWREGPDLVIEVVVPRSLYRCELDDFPCPEQLGQIFLSRSLALTGQTTSTSPPRTPTISYKRLLTMQQWFGMPARCSYAPDPRKTRPGRSSVRAPSSRITFPFTITVSMPSAYWCGSWNVARSMTRSGSNTVTSA